MGTAWNGWSAAAAGTDRKRIFTDFTLSGGATASVRVLVQNYNPGSGSIQPKVWSEATITIPNESRTLTKVVEVDLRRRSRFAMGLVARNQITFKGNKAKVDSWNSLFNDDGTPRGTPVNYSAGVAHASGSVGSTSVAVGSVAVNNADIFGFASVGGNSTTGLSVGSNGMITGNLSQTSSGVDYSRVATDFSANFDMVASPSTTVVINHPDPLPNPLPTGTYQYNGLISTDLTITGNVTLVLTGAGDNIRLTGGDELRINSGASLKIYANGDIRAGGNGFVNANGQASSLEIYGVNPTAQHFDIGGGPTLIGVVYAPNADVDIHGNPDVMGSIVANNITVRGDSKFHYDEALANWGGNNPFGIVKWLELTTPTARTAAYAGW